MKLTLIGLLLAIPSVFTLHQTQTDFIRDSLYCYETFQERSQSYSSLDTTQYRLGIRYQNYSRSIETFINLVEKIEEAFELRNRRISAETLAKHLLKSYHIYGLKKDKFDIFGVKNDHFLLYDLLSDILLDNGGSTRVDLTTRDLLNNEEQCIMHYMLSRFEWPLDEIQFIFDGEPIRRSNGDVIFDNVKRRMNSKNMQLKNVDNQNVRYDFYEQGVVRFRDSETDAIEPSRVLIGVLIGLSNNIPKLNNYELYEKLKNSENGNRNDQYVGNLTSIKNEKRLDAMTALTLADLWALNSYATPLPAENRKKSTTTGQWNSEICPIYFQMQPSTGLQNGNSNKQEFNGISMAQLRGGLDGLSIAWTLQNRKSIKSQVKLSTILKMYYSPRGLAVESSVCRRQDALDLFLKQLVDPAKQYFQLLKLYLSKGMIKDESDLLAQINDKQMDFLSKLGDIATISEENRNFCQDKPLLRANAIRTNPNAYGGVSDELSVNSINAYNRRKSKFSLSKSEDSAQPSKYAETPNDIIFLLDLSNSLNQQLNIISKILNQHTMYNRETVTILLNRPGKDEFEKGLEPIAWRSSIKDKPVCELRNLIQVSEKQTYSPITRASDLIDRIEFVLSKFKSEQNITMIAGKVFILFNYGSIKHDQSQEFLAAKRTLHMKHRDVRYAIMGQGDRNDLKNLINFKDMDDNVFEVNAQLDSLSESIQNLITDNSAIVMYGKSDWYRSKFGETMVVNYVTPNAVQFFTISPYYFFGSQYLELKFEMRSSRHIKVCYSRWDPKPSIDTTKTSDLECKSTQEQQPLIFYSENPCLGYTKEDCPSIYLGIYGLKDSVPIAECFDPHCANFEQIQYEFSHQGMSGSGFHKFLSFSVLLLSILVAIFQFQNQHI